MTTTDPYDMSAADMTEYLAPLLTGQTIDVEVPGTASDPDGTDEPYETASLHAGVTIGGDVRLTLVRPDRSDAAAFRVTVVRL